jgi:hypothetical protein
MLLDLEQPDNFRQSRLVLLGAAGEGLLTWLASFTSAAVLAAREVGATARAPAWRSPLGAAAGPRSGRDRASMTDSIPHAAVDAGRAAGGRGGTQRGV